jgi:hypothetical protein
MLIRALSGLARPAVLLSRDGLRSTRSQHSAPVDTGVPNPGNRHRSGCPITPLGCSDGAGVQQRIPGWRRGLPCRRFCGAAVFSSSRVASGAARWIRHVQYPWAGRDVPKAPDPTGRIGRHRFAIVAVTTPGSVLSLAAPCRKRLARPKLPESSRRCARAAVKPRRPITGHPPPEMACRRPAINLNSGVTVLVIFRYQFRILRFPCPIQRYLSLNSPLLFPNSPFLISNSSLPFLEKTHIPWAFPRLR